MHFKTISLTILQLQIFQTVVNSANVFNLPFNINQTTWSTNYGNGTPNTEYDFIIIGAGPAGCVLANRLTEISNFTVLLIEAGRPEIPMFTDIPMGAPLLQETDFNWGYVTEPQERACLCMLFSAICYKKLKSFVLLYSHGKFPLQLATWTRCWRIIDNKLYDLHPRQSSRF